MTEAFELPREVATAYRAAPQKALRVLAALADGNGLKAEQLRLVRDETEIHMIPAAITVTLAPDMAKSQVRGRNPQGEALGSAAEIMAAAEALLPQFLEGEAARQEILEVVRRLPGEGFGMAATSIPLKSAQKVFSTVAPCAACAGEAVIPCQLCRGTGRMPCQACRGAGFSPCAGCGGGGLLPPDAAGNSMPCPRCQRTGKITCQVCNGARETGCQACGGQGRTGCPSCGQTGAETLVYQMSATARCVFKIDWRKAPPGVKDVFEKLGGDKIVARKHAEAYWQLPEVRGKELVIDGLACFPVSAATFSVAGKMFPATVAGLQGRIVTMDPVLDPFVKPGISALVKLAKGPLAAAALIDTACKYKLTRRVLADVARRPKKTVYQALVGEYGALLSDKYARAAVTSAARALQAISNGPRGRGLALGAALSAALAVGYYMMPLRLSLFAALAQRGLEKYIALADIAVGLAGALLTVVLIRMMAASALKKILPAAVRAEETGGGASFRPGAGTQGLLAFPLCAAVSVAAAALAAHKPEWIMVLLRR